MVNAQKWLDEKYPKKQREKVKEIYLNEKDLEGELDLADFTNEWLEVVISYYVDESKLEIKNKRGGTKIINCTNVQDWIKKEYPFATAKEKKEWLSQPGVIYAWGTQFLKTKE
ncbi:MAG: hypothetical protein mread185_000073 [Mycoplasmataceae bacterium]|nr:MAG: hypothetical protein mread185_000073 [Mycoplasmataceae bacterium]